eukprot:1368414-Rhodomonas_salina.1
MNAPGSMERTGLPWGQKRELDVARTDLPSDGLWAEATTLLITPVGHCWGVQQATAQSLKSQLTQCALAILH